MPTYENVRQIFVNVLAVLPTDIREDLLLTASDEGISFHNFADFVVSRAGRILHNRKRLPTLNAITRSDAEQVAQFDDGGSESAGQDEPVEINDDELSELLAFAERNGYCGPRVGRGTVRSASTGGRNQQRTVTRPGSGFQPRRPTGAT